MTGRYHAYAQYKDSNVDWLKQIPKNWFSTQIKYAADITLGKMLTKEPKNDGYKLKPYLKAINIQPTGINVSKVEKMWFSPNELRTLRLQSGDVLVSEGGDVGRSAIWNDELEECYIQNAVNRVRPLSNSVSKYLYYWFYFLKQSNYIDVLCNKATIAHYTAEKVEESPLFLPPTEEQINIVNFLDHVATKIDLLISKQEKLIELLKEKRQAVISHTVTKGLNPDAEMKGSGIEHLGEIPKHWSLGQLKYLLTLNPKKSQVAKKKELTCNFVPMDKLKRDLLRLDEIVSVDNVFDGYTYFENEDILMAKVTPCFENQNMVVARNLENGLGFGSSEIYVLRTKSNLLNDYLYYRLQEDTFKQLAAGAMTGAGGLKRVPSEFLLTFSIAFPDMDEQREIVKKLQAKLTKIDLLIERALATVSLIKERKIALISAAVTGKIDVRNWQG